MRKILEKVIKLFLEKKKIIKLTVLNATDIFCCLLNRP